MLGVRSRGGRRCYIYYARARRPQTQAFLEVGSGVSGSWDLDPGRWAIWGPVLGPTTPRSSALHTTTTTRLMPYRGIRYAVVHTTVHVGGAFLLHIGYQYR